MSEEETRPTTRAGSAARIQEAINGITSKGEFQATIGYPIATQILAVNLYDSWMNPSYSLPVGEAIPTYQNIQRTEDPEIAQYFADYFAATTDDERTAASLGVRGVPFFVVDRKIAASGAQPPEVLVQLLEQAMPAEPAIPVVADGAACGPDGC